MSQVIVNLTLPIVVAKIESVLNDNASEKCWEPSNRMDLRQRLTAYVLRRLPVIYVTLDQDSIRRMGTPSQCYSYDQHQQIDRLIQQGLQTLIDDGRLAPLSSGENGASTAMNAKHGHLQEVTLVSTWFG
jgi:hypothetical protein